MKTETRTRQATVLGAVHSFSVSLGWRHFLLLFENLLFESLRNFSFVVQIGEQINLTKYRLAHRLWLKFRITMNIVDTVRHTNKQGYLQVIT
jgi:hypothetical protein